MAKERINIYLSEESLVEADKRAAQLNISRSLYIDKLLTNQLEHNTNTTSEHNPNTLTKEVFMEGINKVIESNAKGWNGLYRDLKEVIEDLQIMDKATNKVGEIIEEAISVE